MRDPARQPVPACLPSHGKAAFTAHPRALAFPPGRSRWFRDHFPVALGALPGRAGQYTGTKAFRRLRSGSEHAGGTAGMVPAGQSWAGEGRGSRQPLLPRTRRRRHTGPAAPPAPGGPRDADGACRGTNYRGARRVAQQRQSGRWRAARAWPSSWWRVRGDPGPAGQRRRQHLVPGAGRDSPGSGTSYREPGGAARRACSSRPSLHGAQPQPVPDSVPPHPVGGASASLLLSPQEWPPRPLGRWLWSLVHLQNYSSLAGSR